MKFEYVRFKGKNSVKKQLINEIKKEAHFTDEISELAVKNYLEILLDGTDYDIDNHVFYEPITGYSLDLEFFVSVAREYVSEHINDFLLEMFK